MATLLPTEYWPLDRRNLGRATERDRQTRRRSLRVTSHLAACEHEVFNLR